MDSDRAHRGGSRDRGSRFHAGLLVWRRPKHRKNKDDSVTKYVQLAHNVWDPGAGCAKAEVIYSFGRADALDVEALKRLAKSIARFLIYFDTTSMYFQVENEDDPGDLRSSLRRRGNSKDRRDDLPEVVIGLAVTREGIPIRCWCWPGNTVDMSVIQQVKKDLVGWKLERVISVVDRGFASEENLRYLQRAGGHYIAGEPMRRGVEKVEEALSRPGRYPRIGDNLEVKEIVVVRVAETRAKDTWRNMRRELQRMHLTQLKLPGALATRRTETTAQP